MNMFLKILWNWIEKGYSCFLFYTLFSCLLLYLSLQSLFNLSSLSSNSEEVSSAVYLQVSIISQALIFVTRSQGWSFLERPGTLLMCAFVVAQLVKFMQKGTAPIRSSKNCFFNLFHISPSGQISQYVQPNQLLCCLHKTWLWIN